MRLSYHRRKTHPVQVGSITIGGDAPIVVQSMTNVDTNDIEAGVAQALRIVEAGGELVRFTAQGVREAKALGEIRRRLNEAGCHTPLSADIHFNTQAAYEALKHVEKVRINPGNFYDGAKRFATTRYDDLTYTKELEALREAFGHFVDKCRLHGRAIRLGVNHGSLSDRIMSRYGDTIEGMVESCMEYLVVCEEKGFKDVVISIKSSNTLVMTQTVRALCKRMDHEGMSYPLHLGVTEAGDGEDGRLKSAVGIGALLSEGIGDTIRVSLSEAPEAEIPVAQALLRCVERIAQAPELVLTEKPLSKYPTTLLPGWSTPLVLAASDTSLSSLPREEQPDLYPDQIDYTEVRDIDLLVDPIRTRKLLSAASLAVVRFEHANTPCSLHSVGTLLRGIPFIIKIATTAPAKEASTQLGFMLGSALLNGIGAGLWIVSPSLPSTDTVRIAYGLLQASRRRFTRTEFISCPSCGRTLFDLQETVARVKAATGHLKGLKIGVMGCIVNGPGEMADADYGYVGSSRGHIDLYKGKERIARNIPQAEAVDCLVELIKSCGDWQDPT